MPRHLKLFPHPQHGLRRPSAKSLREHNVLMMTVLQSEVRLLATNVELACSNGNVGTVSDEISLSSIGPI